MARRRTRRHFRFTLPGLTDSMDCAITWLIEQGGQTHPHAFAPAATRELGSRSGVSVTAATVEALIRKGLVTVGPGAVNGRSWLQLSTKAVGALCDYLENPHPVHVMEAATLHHHYEGTT